MHDQEYVCDFVLPAEHWFVHLDALLHELPAILATTALQECGRVGFADLHHFIVIVSGAVEGLPVLQALADIEANIMNAVPIPQPVRPLSQVHKLCSMEPEPKVDCLAAQRQ